MSYGNSVASFTPKIRGAQRGEGQIGRLALRLQQKEGPPNIEHKVNHTKPIN